MAENPACTSISIILPVFNEERVVGRSIERLLSYFTQKGWDFELIFVEDGCTDNTSLIVKNYCLKDSRIKMVNLPNRLGKGGSITSVVLQNSLKEYVAYMDSDLAADPSELEKLLNHIKNYDLVLGSRILRGDLPAVKRPIHRSFFSHIYSKLFRTLFRIQIHDPQCGLKLFRREITPKLFGEVTILGFAFDTDLIVKAYAQGLRLKEVPINWAHGEFSKISVVSEIYSMGLDLLSIWYSWHKKWQQNEVVYPQKKGSIHGRILFSILSASSKIRERASQYPKIGTHISSVNSN